MNNTLQDIIDDIYKDEIKLHYENEELNAQARLIKELCTEIENYKIKTGVLKGKINSLNNIRNKTIKYIKENSWYCYKDNEENLDRIGIEHILELLGEDENE